MIPDLCRWNLDSEFPSLVVFQTQDSGSLGKTLEDSGFQTQNLPDSGIHYMGRDNAI